MPLRTRRDQPLAPFRILKWWLIGLLLYPPLASGAAQQFAGPATIDLGDIPSRPVPPQWPFSRFFKLNPLNAMAFSPDNRRLFFIRSDGHVDNVFAIDLASGKMTQITHYDEPVLVMVVGNSGRDLFLVRDEGGNEHYTIYRHDLTSEKTTALTAPGKKDMSWICDQSPDGKTLYYGESRGHRASSDLWRIDVDSGERKMVLASQGRLLECGPVSPDGRYLVFYQYIENNERHIGLVDLKEKRHWYVFRRAQVNNSDANFSADSLYFLNAWRTDHFYLWRYRLDSGELTPAPAPIRYPIQSFTLWDAGRIGVFYYRAGLATHTAVRVRPPHNPAQWQLPKGNIVDAIFSDTDPRLAIFVVSDATTPDRYYLSTPDGVTLLYDANESGIAPEQFAEARSLLIPSFDGLPVPTHLFIPNGTSKDNPRPLIVWVHGGPETYIDPEFSSYFQFLANHGYIVATPNARGSSGFGKWYAMLDDHDWCGGHVNDSVAVAEYLKKLDFVDRRNIFIFGESFGGYSVLCALTRYPDVFNAAVVFSPLAELASFLNSLADYAERYLVLQMGFDPRKNRWQNWLRSPYYHADKIHTPLQIHHGKNDFRIPVRQIDAFVARLRALGREVEYYVYENEGHGLMKFENEAKAYERMIDFFGRHRSSTGANKGAPFSFRAE